MNLCPSCGNANPDEASFCSSCGVRLTNEMPAMNASAGIPAYSPSTHGNGNLYPTPPGPNDIFKNIHNGI